MSRRPSLATVLFFFAAVPAAVGEPLQEPDLSAYAEEIAGWERDIDRLVAADSPDDADVLLLGSSSIRLWETAAEDLGPYRVVRRGYGGAKYSDLAYYVRRIVEPLTFRVAVLFVGNDISGGSKDKEPPELGRLFGYVADVIRETHPESVIICIDVRPTPSRFAAWPKIAAGNAALRAACEERESVYYLDTAATFLADNAAAVREELYGPDRLHLSDEGYRAWQSLIREEVDRRLKTPAGR